ncbi:hypothetical protein BKA58DRAFT_125951 [Alternaria rosae]|uniref:uncharacterized protein n=1 Tax=Alternaria rosae TaxID=1187941 RepID=UPI001E8E1BBE|nr:uncharacterized protein BKA58DRAFT_125951 [Alternaria rosae]KAH6875662.1 hypothetical protein BKA58DRAFT_125951 [Alternaria rosae]
MDHTHCIPLGTPDEGPGEALLLLHDTTPRRPYQAYCVTEASSRPSSPDNLIPRPLRTSTTPVLQVFIDTKSVETEDYDQNNNLTQAVTGSPAQYVESATLRRTGQYSKRQTFLPNRKPLPERTRSGNTPNHITRAVTPRGSHSLASSEVTVCDLPSSHPRMQQSTSSNNEFDQTGSHKPIERCDDLLGTHQRPLPPLPLGTASVIGEQQEIDTRSADIYRTSDERAHPEYFQGANELNTPDTQASPICKKNHYLIPRRPLPDLPIDITPDLSSQRAVTERAFSSPMAGEPLHDDFLGESSISARKHRVFGSHTRELTAADPYEPRGHWDDIDGDMRALWRTLPKDANLKYKFGQLPSFNSASPPLISPLRSAYPHSVGDLINATPSFHSSIDIQNGPRPPPWGSYKDLEIQRRQRGDARERAKARGSRLTADSSSIYQKSISTNSLGKDPSREVEEYREQILGVYPDMEFNGEAGRGDREWCCCVLM